MANRVRTLEFLPQIFQTPTNRQFLSATLEQIVANPETRKIEGYIGSKFGYGINANDYYVTEPTKTRTDYQLDPGVVFTKPNESTAQDFISYPGILDSIDVEGGLVDNNNRLFNSQFYSWDSFTNLDKLVNYNQYYWLPMGPAAVTVSTDIVFRNTDYLVTDEPNYYRLTIQGSQVGEVNPTLTLLRGGTYTFTVNQDTQFWIQGAPGVSGYDPVIKNQYVRDIYGVSNNGATTGLVTFNVPDRNAQERFQNMPGNNQVGVVSTLPFSQVNGARLSELKNIDGVTSLENLTVMFYDTGVPDEIGFVSTFYDTTNYDINSSLVQPLTIVVTETTAAGNLITCNSVDKLTVGQTITFTGVPFGNIPPYSTTAVPSIFYITSIDTNTNQIAISETLNGPTYGIFDDSGSMVGYINQGLYEDGYYSVVSENFYLITYVGDPNDPTIRLLPVNPIPVEEKIFPLYGTQWIDLPFYKSGINGYISLVPYISAPLDTLYYQDGTSPNKLGVIRIIDSNLTNTINVDVDILGRKNYTAPNGIVFTNGLKVTFQGDVIPEKYKTGAYYIEGVGAAIELIAEESLIVPEPFTSSVYIPWDTTAWDATAWEGNSYIPVTPDYITIARNSISKNAWSRSNRWFHIDVINATATYNNNPALATEYATQENKAKRPIIEFYPNLKLFDTGTEGKDSVDFIDFRTKDAFSLVAGQEEYYPDVAAYTTYTAIIDPVVVPNTTTKIRFASGAVTGGFHTNYYISDSTNFLPKNSRISDITTVDGIIELTVEWANPVIFAGTSTASIIGTPSPNDDFALYDGARVVFAADTDANVRNKIYISRFSYVNDSTVPVITLTEEKGGEVFTDNQIVVFRGYNSQGLSYRFEGTHWQQAQFKKTVNQPPLFDVFDKDGISFGNPDVYTGTSFVGNKLFAYGIGTGPDDSILGFPLAYSSVDNIGDISFDVSLNSSTFDYVYGQIPQNQKVNTGYVYNYYDRIDYVRELGWKTAVAPSIQYQVFEFNYDVLIPSTTFTCDIAVDPSAITKWPVIQVYINNVIQSSADYTYEVMGNTTVVTLNTVPLTSTVLQVLLLSDQVSKTAYYMVPINLSNNPLNQDITTANFGDIRSHYQSIFYNDPEMTGELFGSNNYRDLGNVVPYGTMIIQNSASLALPGAFLRKPDHNLFNALKFNSNEYIKFKTLLVDTVNNSNYVQRFDPAYMLDDALDQITATKTDTQPFFWSDMLPSKAAYITNTYSFANAMDISIYPLSRIYNFKTANYKGLLVYLTRTIENVKITVIKQLIIGQDYIVSPDSPSLTVTFDLLPGDKITIKEYNQTYGSYVPNTPTKLGLYPAFIPEVVLDSDYTTPTWFIKGHDGSYNKLYGDYNPETGILIDFRDQVLLEFELRIYNNLKLSATIPIQEYEVLPGFFRTTDYTYEEILQIYGKTFLTWVGKNRVDYKTQRYNKYDEYTYNYDTAANKINNASIEQGYWRGVYQYFYDTTTPNLTPWEMLGYKNQPNWWTARYGPAPYTSNNLILWGDLSSGYDWNNGNPVVIAQAVRPELLSIIPVDTQGNLISPFQSIVGNYNGYALQRDWKVGDVGPTEFSYRRSSSWPFDLMRLLALTKPAEFFNLGVDLDNYRYNEEFNQYLVEDRHHLIISDVEIYGSGTAKTSYINWIVDFEKQFGINATANITTLLDNLDVRLVYRLAGFSDKSMLKFYVEKGSANSNNSSLLIPDESYAVLLYDNQPFDRIEYTSLIIQVAPEGLLIFGNSQSNTFFKTLVPKNNGNDTVVSVENLKVIVPNDFTTDEVVVPYNTLFYTPQEVATFIVSYGAYLESQGMKFIQNENGIEITWKQMVAEFLYWAQTGWEVGNVITLNPAATELLINREGSIVQPLTMRQTNFVLNQNLYPIQFTDLAIIRESTALMLKPLAKGDTLAYGQFNLQSIEHSIVFDNVTLFNDVIYNLITGLRQIRIVVRGSKTAEWNGTINAAGFILNQDNIQEWSREVKYTKGIIVKYKNKFWTALKLLQPSETFDERYWKQTDYDQIQKGLLPNAATRAYESTLYYNVDKANLEQDADLLSFSLIGYRPRDYLALADLTDITQVNVYKNLIKEKGTLNALSAFKGANLPQGGINYDIYENWAIKCADFGGTLNTNFAEFKINEKYMTGNPSIASLTIGTPTIGSQQEIPLYSLFNYARPIENPNILPTLTSSVPAKLYPTAGYVNFNDVKMSAYLYSELNKAVNQLNEPVSVKDFYVTDFVWVANYLGTWQVFTPVPFAIVTAISNNLNGSAIVTFNKPHNLTANSIFAVVNMAVVADGYYTVLSVVDPYRIVVPITLDNAVLTITGNGVAMRLLSQRVSTPADINTLPLLNNEFVQNTVWVDTNVDGDWAVFKKKINFQFESEVTSPDIENCVTFGAAVAYTNDLGYLISDTGLGEVYRYTYSILTKKYSVTQIIDKNPTFGTTIAHAKDIFVISQSQGPNAALSVYRLVTDTQQNTLEEYQIGGDLFAPIGSTNWGDSVAISGDANWMYVSDINNSLGSSYVHVYRRSATTGLYSRVTTLTVPGITAGDRFGHSISTDYNGDTVVISAPNKDFNATTDNSGNTYVFNRLTQKIEVQYNSYNTLPQTFTLGWTPPTTVTLVASTSGITNTITCTNTAGLSVNDLIVFSGTILASSNLTPNVIYYVAEIVSSTEFKIKVTKTSDVFQLGTATLGNAYVNGQTTPIFVYANGTLVDASNYAIIGNSLVYVAALTAGDIIEVSGQSFVLTQTLNSGVTPRVGVQFGRSVDINQSGSEILVGAPFALSSNNDEGAVYRFTNGGGRYGIITGVTPTSVSTNRQILINGYLVTIPAGYADVAAAAINASRVTNIQATSTDDGKLVISLIDVNLSVPSEKLLVTAVDPDALIELGLSIFTKTQMISCPHPGGPTQFGDKVKFNEFDSCIISAPVATKYLGTTFDFSDDGILSDTDTYDTIFDNNSTQFVDDYPNAGAVYMFDYLPVYAEGVTNPGQFIYAQNVNALNQVYGAQPRYGYALDFRDHHVIIGTPEFRPSEIGGQAVLYNNSTGIKDWAVYRSSAPIVDINSVQNSQLFSAETNNTLINLDYFDPLQGKLLGAVRQNIDYVSDVDPAHYNNNEYQPNINDTTGLVWGPAQLGQLWFNTSKTKFINYHQNDDVVYNSKYWGTVFPGSDVAVYSWISSDVLPLNYAGPGTPLSIDAYVVKSILNSSNVVVPIYFYWVRHTNIIFDKLNKTLSDKVLESYIKDPKSSGISYFAPLLPNTFGIYNSSEYINANDSVFHIGFSTGANIDNGHEQFTLIRANFADDFLPGIPDSTTITYPESLYDRLLDSLSGVDESGSVVPNPYLPKAVQYGILARPRQSFFINRFNAVKNYLTYANEVLAQFPITEIRNSSYLNAINPTMYAPIPAGTFIVGTEYTIEYVGTTDFMAIGASANDVGVKFVATGSGSGTGIAMVKTFDPGQEYDTANYWEPINWWAAGYNDNTKSVMQIQQYADLSTIDATPGMIVTVVVNEYGQTETYIYEEIDNVGTWTRIGLSNGTIRFKSALWDYQTARLGFGDNFFDTTPYDEYPSEETRWIVRALNEQIYTDDLLIFRNKSLILLFEYIQSETYESQNYLPWLNKTSFIDVSHTIRELKPIQVFQSDNQDFLAGYLNEIKPYHVIIKEFLFKYTGTDVYGVLVSDFDLPAKYNTNVEQFITPALSYDQNTSGVNEYPLGNPIWSEDEYSQWYNNFGLSITGQPNYQIATLGSYLALNTTEFVANNVNGFPINGIITIGTEKIGYANVDRATGLVSGLTRGVDGTAIIPHIPGDQIYIDLPAVVLLESGRGYSEPPRVVAYIDSMVWPEDKLPPNFVPAELKAVMNFDTVLQIDVINPGSGYPVLPEIIIDPAAINYFYSDSVNMLDNTIGLTELLVRTGDLIQYKTITGEAVGGLEPNQWYYLNVVQTSPTFVALYTSYQDAVTDSFRVKLFDQGTGLHSLNIGAKASCVTTAIPIRENNLTLRYDRTSYRSSVTDWRADSYYGAYFAGNFLDRDVLASSSIMLDSANPPIDSIKSSGGGLVFEITGVGNKSELVWSSFVRTVYSTTSGVNQIKLSIPDGTDLTYGSGTTVGFYTGMPIMFRGAVFGGLIYEQIYYVKDIIDELTFTISLVINGAEVSLEDGIASPVSTYCYVGNLLDQAILSVNYPGILTATITHANTNAITIPLNLLGSGGTNGFYVNLPVFFTGNVFGGIFANEVYYVTTVVDNQTFTLSKTQNPTMLLISEIKEDNWIVLAQEQDPFDVNEPVIFNQMCIDTIPTTSFGGIQSGTTYYIAAKRNINEIQISTEVNGYVVPLSIVPAQPFDPSIWPGVSPTRATITSQKDTLPLTNNTGSMIINVALPASPGQVNGQLFTLYQTSKQYYNPPITNGNFLSRIISWTKEGTNPLSNRNNRIILTGSSGGVANLYSNMPFTVSESIGGPSGLIVGETYYVADVGTITIAVIGTSDDVEVARFDASISDVTMTVTNITSGKILLGATILGIDVEDGTTVVNQLTGTAGGIGVYVVSKTQPLSPAGEFNASCSAVTCDSTDFLYDTMPIVFTGPTFGDIITDVTYYVKHVINDTRFVMTNTPNGPITPLTVDNGTLLGTGESYITASDSIGGAIILVDSSEGPSTLQQVILNNVQVSVCSILGGYSVVVTNPTLDPSRGYAATNTITVSGQYLDGSDPANNLTITVEAVNEYGTITNFSCFGLPSTYNNRYYLKVIDNNSFAVYSDQLLTIPVSSSNFNFVGISSTIVTELNEFTNFITVQNSGSFGINDPVVFTGNVVGSLVLGAIYYIVAAEGNDIQVSRLPGGDPVDITITASGLAFSMAKAGSYALLPEPFYFNQSLVRYNNNVYKCIISNNDPEFVFGKWELLLSGDRELNALDRIVGYYQPTADMPGRDMTQLLNGVTYPNNIYLDNAFAPYEQFPYDTLLQDKPFTNTTPTVYDINGGPFLSGYGPEELVPGVVTDDVTMTVSTRPGTTWPVTVYGHTGYNVHSKEALPETSYQTDYYFGNLVKTPISLTVAVIDGTTGLSHAIYEGVDYTVDWLNKVVILLSPLNFTPIADSLRIDAYEAGNGNQIIKSNTDTDPIRYNELTGWNEIALDCKYSGTFSSGSGIIRPITSSLQVIILASHSVTNTLVCEEVQDFVLNSPITFTSDTSTFGGIVSNTTYYVKTVDPITKTITISETRIISTGIAGPTMTLTDAVGSMYANIAETQTWSDPLVYRNGTKLVYGSLGTITATNSTTNTITCDSTSSMAVGTPITFSSNMFGDVLPLFTFNVLTVENLNQFTLEDPANPGSALPLVTDIGSAQYITYDYSFGIAEDGISATMIFATEVSIDTDYISFTLFGESPSEQYNYTLPETQVFEGDGSTAYFDLDNYVGDKNVENAVVEIDGLRQTLSNYVIDQFEGSILFDSPPPANSIVAVTTFNSTDRQYLSTQFGVTGSVGLPSSTLYINQTTNISVPWDDPLGWSGAEWDEFENFLTLAEGDTSSLRINDKVVFNNSVNGATLGGINTGQIYYIRQILSATEFSVSRLVGGSVTIVTNDTAATGNDWMPMNLYSVTVSNIEEVNNDIHLPIAVTVVNESFAATNSFSADDIQNFVIDQTIEFKSIVISVAAISSGKLYQIRALGTTSQIQWNTIAGTVGVIYQVGDIITATGVGSGTGTVLLAEFGGIGTLGQVYYIDSVDTMTNMFTIKDKPGPTGTQIPLTNDVGILVADVGDRPTVRIITGVPHELVDNDLVRIDGVQGAVQLNNNTYYAKVIDPNTVDIYLQPYDPAYGAAEFPVSPTSQYTGSGYIWRNGLFTIETTYATGTQNNTDEGVLYSYIVAKSTADLVIDTPIYFAMPSLLNGDVLVPGYMLGQEGLIVGTEYYVREIRSITEFSVSTTRGGDPIQLSEITQTMFTVSQWAQANVDRLWVTVNGARVPSSSLRVNPANELSILTTIIPGDEVIITSMIPTATPDQEVYLLSVNQTNDAAVYRITSNSATWLTEDLLYTDETIHLRDVSKVTNTIVQETSAPNAEPAPFDNIMYIGLTADKNIISGVSVYNNTTGLLIDPSHYELIAKSLSPTLKMTIGSWISVGDSLTITIIEGNMIYVDGEYIKFTQIDFVLNTISGLQRGANGTGRHDFIANCTSVCGLLSVNQLPELDYYDTWNSRIYNSVKGDPLQISLTPSAIFLRRN